MIVGVSVTGQFQGRGLGFTQFTLLNTSPEGYTWSGRRLTKIQATSSRKARVHTKPYRHARALCHLPMTLGHSSFCRFKNKKNSSESSGCDLAVQASDAASAYTQVKIEDAPKFLELGESECLTIWIRPQRSRRTKSWDEIQDPVVPLARNVCGHQLAGLLWERQFENVLMENGTAKRVFFFSSILRKRGCKAWSWWKLCVESTRWKFAREEEKRREEKSLEPEENGKMDFPYPDGGAKIWNRQCGL